ncbi:lycopene cyclase domain-containing protein [Natronoarchaeum philippinense]|uniref:Lycopene cyclase domain-containing protein n=1 Tax=Natronoarchaeum philippinense TaxID=558529 RepID=A0A285P280_NATPI|nr:lycopene cyclase domain-containing protein [Natronoarchaeum philippinense]SNZ15839.1 lycopene cyclase domain-containing protein [Natronoarchaeum philippinense]
MTAITYIEFHVLFLLPALLVLGLTTVVRQESAWSSGNWVGTALIVGIALAYTTPWDNYLIARGVWWYGDGAVAARVWHAPVEEYLFIFVQPVLAALWLRRLPAPTADRLSISSADRVVGVLAGVGVGVGGALLALRGGTTLYLGAILAWAGPVLAVQWGFGWPVLWRARRTVGVAVAVPTLYLCVADRVALWSGTWTLSDQHTIGAAVFGLPVEEGLFFLVTTLFVVQGLVLFEWVVRT